MSLEMRTKCERCGSELSPRGEAYICSYECTFCKNCSEEMTRICPNCGGELVPRPQHKVGTDNANHINPQGIEPCGCLHARPLPCPLLILVFASSCICLLRQLGHIRK